MDYIDYLIRKEIQEEAKKYADSLYKQYPSYSKIAEEGYIKGYNAKKRQIAIGIFRLSVIALFLLVIICFLNLL